MNKRMYLKRLKIYKYVNIQVVEQMMNQGIVLKWQVNRVIRRFSQSQKFNQILNIKLQTGFNIYIIDEIDK
ncbi:unnamed protein product [Paramecium octaurelia]|uniref:Uncharacterized protein n=1 Tax=Paramecium octaurelia TaxID=43137 RepID=A0A8S1TTB2_PAROT|nr:unnamed protein product [Paramecium octaurelia]